ncbi:MAG: putative selenium-dependent hydroxylase accessory protein YqeC, partial [Lachnospiraceae bacterium]|nr:putative selenium-dependent hydroxylase accessory protein YqeC [Lachnospiraceae bacterium]
MISELLEIKKGITAVIGSGGKTSLILRLADELKINGKVVFCTTTRIM